jgi:hypothetical protein
VERAAAPAGVFAGQGAAGAWNGTRAVPLEAACLIALGLARGAVGWDGTTGAPPAASAQRAAIAGGVTGAQAQPPATRAGVACGGCGRGEGACGWCGRVCVRAAGVGVARVRVGDPERGGGRACGLCWRVGVRVGARRRGGGDGAIAGALPASYPRACPGVWGAGRFCCRFCRVLLSSLIE